MAISNAAVTSSATAIYESTGNNAITTLIFCNTSTYVDATPTLNESKLFVYAVPSGGTADTTTIIVNGLPIPAGETVSFDQEKMVLGLGDKIYAKTDSLSNITATISTLPV